MAVSHVPDARRPLSRSNCFREDDDGGVDVAER